MAWASRFVNLSGPELSAVADLPDVLWAQGLVFSHTALLYKLGYLDDLIKHGSIPQEERETVPELYRRLASQPVSDDIRGPLIENRTHQEQAFQTVVLGIEINVFATGSDTSILVAEAVLGTIEAFLATSAALRVAPHTEMVTIQISERKGDDRPEFVFDQDRMTGRLSWPEGASPADYSFQPTAQRALAEVASSIMIYTCHVPDVKRTLTTLYEDESVVERLSLIAVSSNSYSRAFGKRLSRLTDHRELVGNSYPPRPDCPNIVRQRMEDHDEAPERFDFANLNHRQVNVSSVIDVHLWDLAKWRGTAYLSANPQLPPSIAFLFTGSEEAGRKIFDHWRERFGFLDRKEALFVAIVRGVSDEHPHHYRVLIISNPAANSSRERTQLAISRSITMTPDSSDNLERFLTEYRRYGIYSLMPASGSGASMPDLHINHRIVKRTLSVKYASEIGPHDLERMALRPDPPELEDADDQKE